MKKTLTAFTTSLLLGLALAVSGCATTGMNNDMAGEMGSATEMAAPTGTMMEEKEMAAPVMEENSAPMMDAGSDTMMK